MTIYFILIFIFSLDILWTYRKCFCLVFNQFLELSSPIVDSSYGIIGLMSRVFTNGPEDRSSIPGWVIPKTQKMVLDAALLNTQLYKVRVKGEVEQSREWSSVLPYTLV